MRGDELRQSRNEFPFEHDLRGGSDLHTPPELSARGRNLSTSGHFRYRPVSRLNAHRLYGRIVLRFSSYGVRIATRQGRRVLIRPKGRGR